MAQKRITEKEIAAELKDDAYVLVTQKEVQENGATVEVLRRVPVQALRDEPIEKVTNIAITESADGSVSMVNTFESGGTETIVIGADANGNPNKLTVNGKEIPISWAVSE